MECACGAECSSVFERCVVLRCVVLMVMGEPFAVHCASQAEKRQGCVFVGSTLDTRVFHCCDALVVIALVVRYHGRSWAVCHYVGW